MPIKIFGKKITHIGKRVGRTTGRTLTTAGKITRVGSKLAKDVGDGMRLVGALSGQPEIAAAGQSLYTSGQLGTQAGRTMVSSGRATKAATKNKFGKSEKYSNKSVRNIGGIVRAIY